MTNTTVGHSPNSLRAQARRGDAAAWDALVAQCRPPRFDVAALDRAAALFQAPRSVGQARFCDPGVGSWNGRTVTLSIAPGMVSLGVVDAERQERGQERARAAVSTAADVAATYLAAGDEVPDRVASRVVTEWSAKSRVRMLRAFCSVDWTALNVPGMALAAVTLTYPGDWLAVAPNGRAVKRHLEAFRMRYQRATGVRCDGAWKMEFQGRGAPHFHLLVPVPAMVKRVTFEHWLSLAWAQIVRAESCGGKCWDLSAKGGACCEFGRHVEAGTGVDFGVTAKMSDPKRLAVYFLKHGTKAHDGKEYQHLVPREWLVNEAGEPQPENGPGRFWGIWGMPKAVRSVELDAAEFFVARRVLRRVAAARQRSITYSRLRGQGQPPAVAITARRRRSRTFGSSAMVGGFVVTNDGVQAGESLARALRLARTGGVPGRACHKPGEPWLMDAGEWRRWREAWRAV